MAAESGDSAAQYNLGVAILNRIVKDRETADYNHTEAAKWLLRAARQGLPRAQIKLAERLTDDAPTANACVRACAWYLVAAEKASGIQRHTALTGFEQASRALSPSHIARSRRLAVLWAARIAGGATGTRVGDAVRSTAMRASLSPVRVRTAT